MEIYDTIIIGGGPAGLSAGLYASRAGLQVLLLEKSLLGGQAITTDKIENYPGFSEPVSGFEFIKKMEDQVRRYNLAIEYKEVTSLETEKELNGYRINISDGEPLKARTLIIATGASPVFLNIPGEREFMGRGVSYCATCDGPLFKDKEIIVVGGGNSALEEALFLTRFVKKLTIIHRRDTFRADKILRDRVLNEPKIYILWNSIPKEIKGDTQVREMVVYNLKDQVYTNHKVDGLFVYIGTKPNTEWLTSIVQLDGDGFIIADEKLSTNLPGLFVAGDCRQKLLRQVVTAASDGALAGMMAYHYLQEKPK